VPLYFAVASEYLFILPGLPAGENRVEGIQIRVFIYYSRKSPVYREADAAKPYIVEMLEERSDEAFLRTPNAFVAFDSKNFFHR
jgi:hypothetical protein